MPLSKPMLKKLRERDKWCWHCMSTDDLVPHHRRNRGMGGSKILDRYDNLLLICAEFNGAMESDPDVAAQAKLFGQKLSSWDDFSNPVFDTLNLIWYVLDVAGDKQQCDAPSYLI